MTDQELQEYLELLRRKGWRVELWADAEASALDSSFTQRYPRIPEDYLRFLQRVRSCVNADETVWYLCFNDYNNQSDSTWAWNAMEQIDLEGAEDDERKAEIIEFWKHHLPFMLSVVGEYAYVAFRMAAGKFGKVVEGYDIELTEPAEVVPSFAEFVRLHSALLKGESRGELLGDYM